MANWIYIVLLFVLSFTNGCQLSVALWVRRKVDMAIWIHIVLFFVLSFTNAENKLYVSEESVPSAEAASFCNLATPPIHFKTNGYNVSLDAANLTLADGESVWSGYVLSYAAFLYEGCYEVVFSSNSVLYTDVYSDPGECYSRCNTDVIGIQATTCHCNPRQKKGNAHVTGCNITCSNPNGTVCGGNEAVSIYRKVLYRISGGRAVTDAENCRAFYWDKDGQHTYIWRDCCEIYPYICTIAVASSTHLEHHYYWRTWVKAVEQCLQDKRRPAMDSSSDYEDLNLTTGTSETFWLGQIRSRVISKYADSNKDTDGERRGVIKKSGEEYVLQFITNPTLLKSLCVNASSSESTTQTRVSSTTTSGEYINSSEQISKLNDSSKFPMIAVYAGVPAVLILVAVVVIVILWIRRKHTDDVKDGPALCHDNYENNTISRNAVSIDSYQDCDVGHTYFILEPVNKNVVVNDADINAGKDNEYDTTLNLQSKFDVKSNGTGNAYNTLEDIANDTYNHTNSHIVTIANDTYDKATNDEHG